MEDVTEARQNVSAAEHMYINNWQGLIGLMTKCFMND